jgi:hypothetical protein
VCVVVVVVVANVARLRRLVIEDDAEWAEHRPRRIPLHL